MQNSSNLLKIKLNFNREICSIIPLTWVPCPVPPLRRSTIHVCSFRVLRDTPFRDGNRLGFWPPITGFWRGSQQNYPPITGFWKGSSQNYPLNEGRVLRWRVSTISALAWTGISLGTFSCWIYQRRCTSRSTFLHSGSNLEFLQMDKSDIKPYSGPYFRIARERFENYP